jgi:hypothetical protein
MNSNPTFEDYLIGKKIDSDTFRKAEPETWKDWKREFEQMHPNSFTVQKLNLINPLRRKYPLAVRPETKPSGVSSPQTPAQSSPKPGRPVMMKPKPKMDNDANNSSRIE